MRAQVRRIADANRAVNQPYSIARKVRGGASSAIDMLAHYSQFGWLLITVALFTAAFLVVTILISASSPSTFHRQD